MNLNKPWQIILVAIAVTFLWGSSYVGIQISLDGGYSPGGLALLRYLVASITILLMIHKQKQWQSLKHPKHWGMIFVLGFLGVGAYNLALNYGEETVSAGIASFIESQIPVITSIFAMWLLRERLTRLSWLGFLICTLGVLLIACSGSKTYHISAGIFFLLLAVMLTSLYSIGQKKLLLQFTPLTLTAYAMWAGTLPLLLFTSEMIKNFHHATWAATAAAIYLGIFPGTVAYSFWNKLLQIIPASKASSYLYLMPLSTIILGWLFLAELPPWTAVIGAVIAISGALMIKMRQANALPPTLENQRKETMS